MSKIVGDQNPEIGKIYRYSIIDDTEINLAISNEIVTYIWEIYLQQSTGNWVNITSDKNPKIGKEVTYDFTQKAKGRTYKLIVKRATKGHFSADYNFEELKEFLIVPTSSSEQKIQKVILYNRGARDVNKASYTDTLVAKAFCIGMFRKRIEFQVWEDDAKGPGHNAEINKHNAIPTKYYGIVDKYGVAEVKIPLNDNPKLFQKIANRYMMAGEKDEGAFHEYYVTASYLGSIQGASQVNVEVENPSYKKEKISKESALFPIGKGTKRQDVAQKITSAVFVDKAGERLKRTAVGDRVRVKLSTEGFKDKYLQYVVWEKDTSGNHDEVYRSNRIQMPYDVHIDEGFVITEEIFKKGIDFSMGYYFTIDPDAKKQNYFLEVIPLDVSIASKKFGIDDKIGLMEVERVRSPSKVEYTAPLKLKERSTNNCPNCEKDITVEELQKVYSNVKDISLLKELAQTFNKYKKHYKLDTCARKAHFFAQSIQEAGLDLKGGLKGESLDYSAEGLPLQFANFRKRNASGKALDKDGNVTNDNKKTVPNELAYKYGRSSRNGYVANVRKIAEIAYGDRKDLGNLAPSDAWNFRGRGLLQITGRSKYKEIQKRIDKFASSENVKIEKGEDRDYTIKEATLTGMADWYKDDMYIQADKAGTMNDDDVVNLIVDIINKHTTSKPARRNHYQKTKVIFLVGSCKNISKKEVNKEEKSTKKGYDIDKAVAYVNKNALPKSNSDCALYVRKAINAGGINNIYGHAREYYDTDKLVQYGFKKIGIDIEKIQLKKGDIAAFGSVKGHKFGHVAMWNGEQWVSDFKQQSFWVANQYSMEKKYAIYRWEN